MNDTASRYLPRHARPAGRDRRDDAALHRRAEFLRGAERRRVQGHAEREFDEKYGYFFAEMESRVVPNMQRLQAGCRKAGIEVMYTLIRNLTKDGRDRSLDYKITGFNVPPDSWDGQVIDAIKPAPTRSSSPRPRPTSSSRPTSTTCCAISARAIW